MLSCPTLIYRSSANVSHFVVIYCTTFLCGQLYARMWIQLRPVQRYKTARKSCERDEISRRLRLQPRTMMKLSKNSVNQRESCSVSRHKYTPVQKKNKKKTAMSWWNLCMPFHSFVRRADISSSSQFMCETRESIIIINSRIIKLASIRGALTRPGRSPSSLAGE